jgi:hypothetical protein
MACNYMRYHFQCRPQISATAERKKSSFVCLMFLGSDHVRAKLFVPVKIKLLKAAKYMRAGKVRKKKLNNFRARETLFSGFQIWRFAIRSSNCFFKFSALPHDTHNKALTHVLLGILNALFAIHTLNRGALLLFASRYSAHSL